MNNNNNQALITAIRNHQFEEVRNLLEQDLDRDKININGGDPTPLCEACRFATRDARIVALLLENGADPNHGQELVIMNGKSYYSNKNSLLWWLIRRHATTEILSHLLRWGADPNVIRPSNGWSILHSLCYDADYNMIELLLRHGANPNQPDKNGELPVFRLICFGDSFNENRLSCLRLLLECGVDPNVIKSDCGTPPLFLVIHLANGERRLDAIRLMMQHGADLYIPLSITPPSHARCANCIKGDTILHAAVRLRDVDAVRLMTESLAITTFWSLRNENGDTVYDLAVKLEAAPIIEYFDMKWRQWRQERYDYFLQDWMEKPGEEGWMMIHRKRRIDDVATSDVDAAMPVGDKEVPDGIFVPMARPWIHKKPCEETLDDASARTNKTKSLMQHGADVTIPISKSSLKQRHYRLCR